MEFRILGPLEVLRAGRPLELGTRLQRTLLALLLLDRGRSVPVDRIVDGLWPEEPPEDPEASVQTYVFRLRRLLEPARERGAPPEVLLRGPAGYRLAVEPAAVDAERFAELAAHARALLDGARPADALTTAGEALALWRGPSALPEFADQPFARAPVARLAELRLGCEEDRLAAALALGRARDAIPDLEALAAGHPERERPLLLLMTALHRAGRSPEALDRYARGRAWLDRELGLEPGSAVRELQERILRGEAGGASPGPARAAPVPGLVGRRSELARLTALVTAADDGPRFAVVEGEPGIGKTRLAGEAVAVAGVRTAWAVCHEDDDAPALWPWRQLLAALPLPTASLDLPSGSAEGIFAVFDRVAGCLRAAAATEPLLLVLDDLQWADPASLRLLAFLAPELRGVPVRVLATCRTGTRSAVLSATLDALARTPGFLRLPLGALDLAETAALVRHVGGRALPPERLGALHERSGGNPFFATELARLLAEDPRSGTTDAVALPTAVRDTVERRLAHLPDEVRPALRLAAVAGPAIDLALLLRAGSVPEHVLLAGLDAALDAGLLVADGVERLRFPHALVRDAVLAGTGNLERRRLHATIAGLLPASADAFERAHHLVSGRPFTDAAAALAAALEAADRAEASRAHDSAAAWYERALAVVEAEPALDRPPTHRSAVLLRLGGALALAGRRSAAHQRYAETVDAALAADDPGTAAAAAGILARTAAGWFWPLHGDHPAELLARLEATAAALGPADSPARVRVLATLATGSYYGPDPGRRDEASAAALAGARRLGDPALVAEALEARLAAIWEPSTADEQIRLAGELIDSALPGQELPVLVARLRRCVAHLELARADEARADLRAGQQLAADLRVPVLRRQLFRMAAALATAEGDVTTAEAAIERGSVLLDPEELPRLRDIDDTLRAVIRLQQGREAASLLGSLQAPPPGPQLLLARARVQAGDVDGARALAAAHDLYRELPPWWDRLALTWLAADLAAEVGDRAAAEVLLPRLAPFPGHLAVYGTLVVLGPVDDVLGRLAALTGRPADGERHLRAAVTTAERTGLRACAAGALLHLAQLLSPDRPEEARTTAARAGALAHELGMDPVARRAAEVVAGSERSAGRRG